MPLQPNICSRPEVDKLLLKHNNRPMEALHEALMDTANPGVELPMAIIMDRRCGIERSADDLGQYYAGATPLMLAIHAGRLDVAKALLAAGADPNANASNGRNCLMVAADNNDLEVIASLISYGADINAVDGYGYTPLHYAVGWGDASVIGLLERVGANLEAVDKIGRTPLHKAASLHSLALPGPFSRALLKLGANQAAVDNQGRTPLHIAAATQGVGIEAIEAFRCNVAAFEANLTALDKKGCTPLQLYTAGSSYNPRSDVGNIRALLTPK